MTTQVLDTFTEASDTALTSHTPDTNVPAGSWAGNGTVDGATDKLKFSAASQWAVINAGTSGTAVVKVDFTSNGGANRGAVACKCSSDSTYAARDGYFLNFRPDLNAIYLYETLNATATELDSDTAPVTTLNNSGTFTFEIRYDSGSLTVYINGTQETDIAGTDSTYSANTYAGVEHAAYAGTGGRFDNFQADDSVSSSLNVSATTDALTLAEYAATIGKSLNISATTDALTLAEYAATVGSAIDISATTDALTLAEYPATIGLSLNIAANTDALTLAEYPATLGSTQNVQATTDALTLAEYPATIGLSLGIQCTTDALTLAEYRATISDAAAVTTTTPQVGGWYFPKVKRNDWRERSAKERREYLERLLNAAEAAPEDVREEVEEIIESVTGREEVANVTRIEVARINKLIARIERALEDEDETVLLLLSA